MKKNAPEEETSETKVKTEIENMVSDRLAEHNSFALSSQVQKALPNVTSSERAHSLHVVLKHMSDETLIRKKHESKKRRVTLQVPKKSDITPEITVQNYMMPITKDKLLTDEFVRSLPVPLQEKRQFRDCAVASLKKPSLNIQIHDYFAKVFENMKHWFDFWSDTLKVIEGQQGAAVVAYFLFLRWLLFMNFIIFLLSFIFIVAPQVLFIHADTVKDINHTISVATQEAFNERFSDMNLKSFVQVNFKNYDEGNEQIFVFNHQIYDFVENITNTSSLDVIIEHCHTLYLQQIANQTTKGFLATLQYILQGTGFLEHTALFIGSYPPFYVTSFSHTYNVPFAFICVFIATFVCCCSLMIRYSSAGIQEISMTQTRCADYYSNEVFSGWNHCIEEPTIADQHCNRFVFELKTSLHDDRSSKKYAGRSAKDWAVLYAIRFLINSFVITWLSCSLYLIYSVAIYQMQEMHAHKLRQSGLRTLYIQFLPSVVVVILNCLSPVVFDILLSYEQYSSQTAANLSLFRNVFLYLTSIIVLSNTIQKNVDCKPKDICGAGLDETCHPPRCWETYVGQAMHKLFIVDMSVYIMLFCFDLLQYYVTWNFDNQLTRFWGHPIFFLPTEVLAIVFSQTILWLGVFYSPLLPAFMICKIIIIFYIKRAKILSLCDPAEESYRTSRFNSMFISILFISFFFSLIVHSYAIEKIPPSRGCGPFRYHESIVEAIPESIRTSLSFLMSYWTISFATILLCFAIHYYWGVSVSHKELVNRLKTHLVLESYDKQYLLKSIAQLSGKTSPQKIIDRSKMRR